MERMLPVQDVRPGQLTSEHLRITVTARCPCYNLSGYSLSLRAGKQATVRAWRYRLGVRTEDSQSSNPGSIPGSATNYLPSPPKADAARDVPPEAAFK